MFVNPSMPNLTDFTTYVYAQGVSSTDLPSNSDYLVWALGYALNTALAPPPTMGGSYVNGALTASPYVMAVYQLGMHHLVMIAQDVSPSTTFTDLRTKYGFLTFTAGPIVSSEDQGTNETLMEVEWMKSMTLSAMELLKSPWGRMYLQYAQSYGPNIVGVS
jgi:hypothetical protein